MCCLYLCVCAESKHHHHPSWGEKTHRLSQNTYGLERVKMLLRSKFMKEQKNYAKVNNICKYLFFLLLFKERKFYFYREREKNQKIVHYFLKKEKKSKKETLQKIVKKILKFILR